VIRLISGAAAAILLALVLVLATRDIDNGLGANSPLVGQLVPAIVGTDFAGRTFDVDEHKNSWVLVNFFASWCVPCIREHPELDEWSRRHEFDGIVISVPFGDTEKDARKFFTDYGGDWPVLMDTDALWAVAFGVLRPPESFLAAPGGTVVARWQGAITADALDEVMASVELEAFGS